MASTRRPAAIIHVDVVGYSRLMGADEAGTHERPLAYLGERLRRRSGQGSISAIPPLRNRWFADTPLEGDGFELFVPQHESPEFRSIPGIAGSSSTGSGHVGGGLHRRYRGGQSHCGFVLSCMRSAI